MLCLCVLSQLRNTHDVPQGHYVKTTSCTKPYNIAQRRQRTKTWPQAKNLLKFSRVIVFQLYKWAERQTYSSQYLTPFQGYNNNWEYHLYSSRKSCNTDSEAFLSNKCVAAHNIKNNNINTHLSLLQKHVCQNYAEASKVQLLKMPQDKVELSTAWSHIFYLLLYHCIIELFSMLILFSFYFVYTVSTKKLYP